MTPIYQRGQEKRGVTTRAPGQRTPRKRNRHHLAAIARLPCAIPGCGSIPVHVAHLRFANEMEGAGISGKGVKPDDWRTLPLCPRHHLAGPDAQHSMNEEMFWIIHGINAYALARALYNLSGQHKKMLFLVEHAQQLFPSKY